jgi:hypothetical protein
MKFVARHNRVAPGMSIDLSQIVIEGAIYDFIKWGIGALIVTGALAFIARLTKRLESVRDIVYFSIAAFVAVFALIFLIAPRTQGPQLAGTLQTITAGGINSDHDTIVVIALNVLNSGTMQSIVKNWNVTSTINSRIYQGSFLIPPPKDFTFKSTVIGPNIPTSITYHGDDNIIEKAMTPIPQGGLMAGLLFVEFHDIAPSVFAAGADYTVSFEDALSRKYSVGGTSTAKLGPIAAATGIHADLVCPAPPPGPPVSIPTPAPLPDVPLPKSPKT